MLVQLCNDGKFVVHTPAKASYYTHLQIFLAALEETRDEIEERYERTA